MTVSTGAYLQQHYNQIKSLGDKSVSSDAQFVIEGFEDLRLLTKQFPWPTLTSAGEIEIAGPLGMTQFQPQQVKIAQQGQMQFYETRRGDMQAFLEKIIASGGRFNAKVYEGTMDKYQRACNIVDCFLQLDNPDRDWENRSQVTTISGTLFFHYFGDHEAGNTP
ncbi:hypothetical protein LA345_39000 (plasmid) [Burkholderia vietnamiensis]|uniref:Uncharacterized protein n=1 Tax=Burkholderia vietnamiensis (strain G4 / LMG 22486) TaxID=269482 RepID=A4JWG0_BURVG|nr:hypothetical protein Bcep1808_7743 [Burkholderia vietnamiensis G4]MCB4349788.1 hypothetical protein [Burkholderia vietnamiensis]